jgi:chromosome segregation ATPase
MLAEAREQLGMSGPDVLEHAYERLVRAHAQEKLDRAATSKDRQERERLQAEMDALRSRSRVAFERADELGRSLRAREQDLQELERRLRTEGGSAATVDAAAEIQRQRLTIRDLKGRVTEATEERDALRREQVEMAAMLEALAAARPAAPAAPAEDDPEDPGDDATTEDRPSSLALVPRFSRSAAQGLRSAPALVGREAVRLAGILASGDAAAWSAVKRLAIPRDLFSIRLGIHHRMLFRRSPEELEVVEVVARKDLDRAIARYR